MSRPAAGQRGIALITVILLLLVLTVLGIAASMLMTQEDRTSARQNLQRAAFYAAEAGLRRGEANLLALSTDNINLMLAHVPQAIQAWTGDPTSSSNKPTQPTTLGDPRTWTVDHLGTYMLLADSSGALTPTELVNQQVAFTGGGGAAGPATKTFYTLYIRNNAADLGVTVTNDTDLRVRLISVGFITSSDAQVSGNSITGNYVVLAVKILEEEWSWSGVTQAPALQKSFHSSGSGSLLFGG
jgi:type IV pilus assembly protein PilX